MKIAIGCDHHGLEQKKYVIKLLEDSEHVYEGFGCVSGKPLDYPEIVDKVARR